MFTFLLSKEDNADKREKVMSLYCRYYSLMCYIAAQMLPYSRQQDIDDIVQDTFLSILEHIENIDITDEVKSKSLCILITKRKAIDSLRKIDNNNIHIDDISEESISNTDDPDILVNEQICIDTVIKIIGELNDTYRDVCRLKYIHQMTEKEIANLLKLSPKVVNMRIARGKFIIRDRLRKELYNG